MERKVVFVVGLFIIVTAFILAKKSIDTGGGR